MHSKIAKVRISCNISSCDISVAVLCINCFLTQSYTLLIFHLILTEWEEKGQDVVEKMVEKLKLKYDASSELLDC